MPDPAPLLPDQPGLQGGGTFPTQVRIADGTEPMAHVRAEDTGDILVWLGDSMITASKILLSYMDARELQSLILHYSIGKMDYQIDSANLFSSESSMFVAENALWIEDVINGNPVQFVKQANQQQPSQQTQQQNPPMSSSRIQRPDIPVFTPSNSPSINTRS